MLNNFTILHVLVCWSGSEMSWTNCLLTYKDCTALIQCSIIPVNLKTFFIFHFFWADCVNHPLLTVCLSGTQRCSLPINHSKLCSIRFSMSGFFCFYLVRRRCNEILQLIMGAVTHSLLKKGNLTGSSLVTVAAVAGNVPDTKPPFQIRSTLNSHKSRTAALTHKRQNNLDSFIVFAGKSFQPQLLFKQTTYRKPSTDSLACSYV